MAAICWISGLSSISTSGSVFDDACCSTFWMSDGPGTAVRLILVPIAVPHFSTSACTCDVVGSSV